MKVGIGKRDLNQSSMRDIQTISHYSQYHAPKRAT